MARWRLSWHVTPICVDGPSSWRASRGSPSPWPRWTPSAPSRLARFMLSLMINATSRSAQIRCRSEEHTSELQSLVRISYAVFCLKKKKHTIDQHTENNTDRTLPTDIHKYNNGVYRHNTSMNSTHKKAQHIP